jgi:hypothetical protein
MMAWFNEQVSKAASSCHCRCRIHGHAEALWDGVRPVHVVVDQEAQAIFDLTRPRDRCIVFMEVGNMINYIFQLYKAD